MQFYPVFSITSEGHNNKEYIIANETNYSLADIASLLSELSGNQITYISPEKEVFKDSLSKAGVPMDLVTMVAAFCEAIKEGEFNNTGKDLGTLLGRKPTTLKEYLQSVYGNNK